MSHPGFTCPFCGDQTEIITMHGIAKCSECKAAIESHKKKYPCVCGGRTIVRTGIDSKWHCLDCGKCLEAAAQ